jgi:hypothetical protein
MDAELRQQYPSLARVVERMEAFGAWSAGGPTQAERELEPVHVSPVKGPALMPSRRQRVLERDGYRCVICGTDRDLTLDHWIPKSRGGKTKVRNLKTMCAPCNNRKGDLLPEEFLNRG